MSLRQRGSSVDLFAFRVPVTPSGVPMTEQETQAGPPTADLTDAALALGWGYQRTRDAVLRGTLRGWRDAHGHWHVSLASLEHLKRQQQDAATVAA